MHSSSLDPNRQKRSSSEDNSKTLNHPLSRWFSLAGLWLCLAVLFVGIVFLVERAAAQVAPVMTVARLGTNQVQITVTNAAAGAQYELQRVSDLNALLDPGYIWPTEIPGALGQTNFVIEMGIFYSGYFRILGCIDCDGDGVPNYQDAQPGNTNVGFLFITIDSPASGANIQ